MPTPRESSDSRRRWLSRLNATRRALTRLGETCPQLIAEPVVDAVIEYIADRMVPGSATAGIEVDKIFEDHTVWCGRAGWTALTNTEFVDEFDRNRHQQQLEDKIPKSGTRYYGVRFVSKQNRRLASKRGAPTSDEYREGSAKALLRYVA